MGSEVVFDRGSLRILGDLVYSRINDLPGQVCRSPEVQGQIYVVDKLEKSPILQKIETGAPKALLK